MLLFFIILNIFGDKSGFYVNKMKFYIMFKFKKKI